MNDKIIKGLTIANSAMLVVGAVALYVHAQNNREEFQILDEDLMNDRAQLERYKLQTRDWRAAVAADFTDVGNEIKDLEDRLATRIWELEKRAGLAPKEGDPDTLTGV